MRDALLTAAERSVLLRCGARTTSGWLLDGYLVAPGLLLSYEQARKIEAARDPGAVAPKITVLLRRGSSRSPLTLDAVPAAAGAAVSRVEEVPHQHQDDVVHATGRVVAVWRCKDLDAGLQDILDEWKLAREDCEPDSESDEGEGVGVGVSDASEALSAETRHLLSLFLLLRLRLPGTEGTSARKVLEEAFRLTPELPPRGVPLCLASAPLGSAALLGAVSLGVVSGVSPGGLLMLTDARAAPGSEGAPVYAVREREREPRPVALVLSPLSWWRGEAVGFTLCVPLRRVLAGAGAAHVRPTALPPAHRERQDVALGGIDGSVLLVRCGHLWGSGFLVDKEKGIILTCAHVVGQVAQTATVRWGTHSEEADVVWRAADGVPYDVAVLRLPPHRLPEGMLQLPLDVRPPVVGETVFAAGFPLFPETLAPTGWQVRPLVSRGQVSGWWPSARSQILTSCTVQSGASGGPLVRPGSPGSGSGSGSGSSPRAIGMLVCTAQLGSGRDSVVYPNVNLAIWLQAIAAPLRRYLSSEDARELDELRCRSTAVHKQWRLEPPSTCKL